ncbi:MAG: hypothetical protein ACXAC8_16050 [Candidatus Hodarchaeales archaeon]|jgi:hypothetical protein
MVDITLTIVQSVTAFVSFLTCVILTFLVLRKDYRYLLNQLFSLAILLMGLTTLFLVFSNLPVIFLQVDSPVIFLQVSYQSAVLAFFFFNLAAIYMIFGRNGLFSIRTLTYFVVGNIGPIYVIWFTNPFTHVELGDVVSTTLFKVVVFGFLILSYLVTLILFLIVYRSVVAADVRRNLQIFLVGWIVGGLSMVSIALGDFLRILDIIGQLLLTLSVIVIYFSFNQQMSKEKQAQ